MNESRNILKITYKIDFKVIHMLKTKVVLVYHEKWNSTASCLVNQFLQMNHYLFV